MTVCLLDKICYMYEGTPKPQHVTIQVKCCSCCSFLHITALFRATIIKKQMQLFSVLIGTRYELKNLLFVSIALRGAYLLKQYLLALWFGAVVQWLSLLHNFIQQSLNSGSAQVQTLLAVFWTFTMVRISASGPVGNKTKRLSLVNCTTKTIHLHQSY